MAAVHYAVTRKVRTGFEEQFDSKLFRFVRESMSSDGVVGVHILRPPPESDCREYGVLRSFESESAASAFYSSKLFQSWLAEVEPLVDGEPIHRRLNGLEAFFRSERGWMPPRWKMAVITFLGVLPSVLFWQNLIQPVLSKQHWLFGAIAVNIAVVVTLTWVVMPLLTKLFHPWLRGNVTR